MSISRRNIIGHVVAITPPAVANRANSGRTNWQEPVPQQHDGEACNWCGKHAIRREIVARTFPRSYVGACKDHLGDLRAVTSYRARHLEGLKAAEEQGVKIARERLFAKQSDRLRRRR